MSDECTRHTDAIVSRLLALSLAWISRAASAEVTVQVARQENAFELKANLLVAVDQYVSSGRARDPCPSRRTQRTAAHRTGPGPAAVGPARCRNG